MTSSISFRVIRKNNSIKNTKLYGIKKAHPFYRAEVIKIIRPSALFADTGLFVHQYFGTDAFYGHWNLSTYHAL